MTRVVRSVPLWARPIVDAAGGPTAMPGRHGAECRGTNLTVREPDLFQGLDFKGPAPLYFQIANCIERAILDGRLPAGARLANEIALSTQLGISRPTIRRGIQRLVDKGLLVRRRGIGTQVVHGPVNRKVELTSLYDDLKRSHQQPTTDLIQYERVLADDAVASILNIARGSHVLHLRRVRKADEVPIAVLENFLLEDVMEIRREDLVQHGLYALLRAQGVMISIAKQRIGARRATGEESQLLEIEKGGPVLTMDRTAYDNSGRAVEYGHHCYRPDLYSFEITLVDK